MLTVRPSVRGSFLLMQAALRLHINRRKASEDQQQLVIVNVASTAASHPELLGSIYSMSKAALVSLTKSVAKEYGDQQVRCVAVSPVSFSCRKQYFCHAHRDRRAGHDGCSQCSRLFTFCKFLLEWNKNVSVWQCNIGSRQNNQIDTTTAIRCSPWGRKSNHMACERRSILCYWNRDY